MISIFSIACHIDSTNNRKFTLPIPVPIPEQHKPTGFIIVINTQEFPNPDNIVVTLVWEVPEESVRYDRFSERGIKGEKGGDKKYLHETKSTFCLLESRGVWGFRRGKGI